MSAFDDKNMLYYYCFMKLKVNNLYGIFILCYLYVVKAGHYCVLGKQMNSHETIMSQHISNHSIQMDSQVHSEWRTPQSWYTKNFTHTQVDALFLARDIAKKFTHKQNCNWWVPWMAKLFSISFWDNFKDKYRLTLTETFVIYFFWLLSLPHQT